MAALEQAQADLPRGGFGPITGGRELLEAEFLVDLDYFPSAPPAGGSQIKYWNGTSWGTGALMRWNGSAWVAASMSRWDGASWVTV